MTRNVRKPIRVARKSFHRFKTGGNVGEPETPGNVSQTSSSTSSSTSSTVTSSNPKKTSAKTFDESEFVRTYKTPSERLIDEYGGSGWFGGHGPQYRRNVRKMSDAIEEQKRIVRDTRAKMSEGQSKNFKIDEEEFRSAIDKNKQYQKAKSKQTRMVTRTTKGAKGHGKVVAGRAGSVLGGLAGLGVLGAYIYDKKKSGNESTATPQKPKDPQITEELYSDIKARGGKLSKRKSSSNKFAKGGKITKKTTKKPSVKTKNVYANKFAKGGKLSKKKC